MRSSCSVDLAFAIHSRRSQYRKCCSHGAVRRPSLGSSCDSDVSQRCGYIVYLAWFYLNRRIKWDQAALRGGRSIYEYMSHSKNHALARLRGRVCTFTWRMCRHLLRRELFGTGVALQYPLRARLLSVLSVVQLLWRSVLLRRVSRLIISPFPLAVVLTVLSTAPQPCGCRDRGFSQLKASRSRVHAGRA